MAMMAEQDYYRVLQVDPAADPEVIEAAYRRLARKYHPDTGGSAASADQMKLLNRAYETLRSPELRAAYDRERRPRLGRGVSAEPAGRPDRPRQMPTASSAVALIVQLVIVSVLATFVFRLLQHPVVLLLVLVAAGYLVWQLSRSRG